MRLDELIGVKRYRQRDLWDVLRDFEAAGGEFLGQGKYASVIGAPSWNFVYKFFRYDHCYLRYVRMCQRMGTRYPSMPRILDRPKWIVPFYRRHRSEGKMLCVVKMERLIPWQSPARDIDILISGAHDLYRVIGDPAKEREWLDQHDSDAFHNQMVRYKRVWAEQPELRELTRLYYEVLLPSNVPCSFDIHQGNIMQRGDGTLVMIDPFWVGVNFYAEYNRVMQAERGFDYDYEEPPEHEFYPGGSTKLPKPPEPEPWEPDEGDIPF